MLSMMLLSVLWLGQISPALLQTEVAPSTQPAVAAASTTKPTDGNVLEAFDRTRLFKIFKGEEKLSPEQLGQIQFWVNLIKEPLMAAIGVIPRIFVALFFLFIFWIIYRGIRRVVIGSMRHANVDQSIRDMLSHLIKWGIMGFGLVIACNQLGIQITALLTGVSIIGLAIGFAAQETLSNFIAGVVIFWDHPFGVGDWIEVDGTFGQVQRVTFRSTRLLNLDGEVIVFPNTYMLANKVANHSSNPVNRINIPIGIAYKESIDQARSVLLSLTNGDQRLASDPPPSVVVKECAASSVDLVLRFWVVDESMEKAMYYEYLEKAKKALDAAGIEIPFPHMQLFLEETEAVKRLAGDRLTTQAA